MSSKIIFIAVCLSCAWGSAVGLLGKNEAAFTFEKPIGNDTPMYVGVIQGEGIAKIVREETWGEEFITGQLSEIYSELLAKVNTKITINGCHALKKTLTAVESPDVSGVVIKYS